MNRVNGAAPAPGWGNRNVETMDGGVRVDIAGQVATITLDHEPRNVLSRTILVRLGQAAHAVTHDDGVRAVVITGGPRTFSAGADIRELAALDNADVDGYATLLQETFTAVAAIPKPVVAAIRGYALGGGLELALTADRRVCSAQSFLGLPETGLGLIPGAGGTQRLRRHVGLGVAKDMIFTGRMVDAPEAKRLGLIDVLVADEDVQGRAREWAEQCVSSAPLALAAAKAALDGTLGLDLADALDAETALFVKLLRGEDRRIGTAAFLAKEKSPAWVPLGGT